MLIFAFHLPSQKHPSPFILFPTTPPPPPFPSLSLFIYFAPHYVLPPNPTSCGPQPSLFSSHSSVQPLRRFQQMALNFYHGNQSGVYLFIWWLMSSISGIRCTATWKNWGGEGENAKRILGKTEWAVPASGNAMECAFRQDGEFSGRAEGFTRQMIPHQFKLSASLGLHWPCWEGKDIILKSLRTSRFNKITDAMHCIVVEYKCELKYIATEARS